MRRTEDEGRAMFLLDTPELGSNLPAWGDPAADPLGAFFLLRLSRMLAQRFRTRDRPAEDRPLLDKAIYSTYRDLQALHREAEARALLREYRGQQ